MREHDPGEYGRHFADAYDAVHGETLDTDDAVERLVALAQGGPVLELGVGTGRLALPLVEHGLDVVGVDASVEMLGRLKEKPHADRIELVAGDFTDLRLSRRFKLVVLAYNTLFAIPDQDGQVRCFETAAAHLEPGGAFVLEAFVPDRGRYERGPSWLRRSDSEMVELEVAERDSAAQRIRAARIVFTGDAVQAYPVEHRYAWPSELDLMARLAGLRLRSRHGGWRGEPFTDASGRHVSTYGVDG